MIYQLLNDLKRYWSDKESLAPEEKEMLQRLTKALPAMLCEQSCEQLAPGEVLVRICPDTRRQVLVCHNGDGQCVCLLLIHRSIFDCYLHPAGRKVKPFE